MIITVGSKVVDDQGNNYVLDEVLGKGGFGNVYKAHRENGGEEFAVKIIQNTFGDQTAFLSFKKETNLSMLIESENVIKYLYIHNGEDHPEYPPYIIMEYTDGGTLRDLIKNQNGEQFDIETLNSIFLQLATGMKCISEHLVHRDIKPENILNFDGVLKITDFGLSKISGESTKTMTFKNAGTPLYIAPEAWNNDSNTVQMDIYSMGVVFYELATLSYPYKIPTNSDYTSFRNMHLYSPANNPSTINTSLSPQITSLIIKMLEKPTQKRYKNWDEIINALESAPMPKDDLSDIVNRAVSIRNQKDLEWQQKQAEKKKTEEEREEFVKLCYSQYLNAVSTPIHEFADRFNTQYTNTQKISIKEQAPSHLATRFSTEIKMPSGHGITITGEVLFAEQITKTYQSLFGNQIVHSLPQCKGKDIVLWCQLKDKDSLGLNILLLKNGTSIYGDWTILENTASGLSRIRRPSPFGFDLSELPEQINFINVTHIYNLNLSAFSIEKILSFIAERV